MAADFATMGVQIELPKGDASDAFQVWAENWESLCCFLDCQTQWRIAVGQGGSEYLGLDYPAVDVVLRRTGAPESAFADLQVMELAALAAFGEQNG